jgi:cytochrome c oxidase subunit I+III
VSAEPIPEPTVPPDHLLPSSEDADREAMERVWAHPKGLRGWLTTCHHTTIGKRYIMTALFFFGLGGIEAAMMRWQLAFPEHGAIGADRYNQLFTVHGSTMMFLFAVPVMEGMGIYLVPLMLGTRNVAFPRLNAFSYYMFLTGGLFLYSGLLLNTGPDAGWFAYVPLSGPAYSPGKRVDIWAQMITFTEISALAGAVHLIVTIFRHKAPGMSLGRMPIFVWATLISSLMTVFAMPLVAMASSFLAMDRLVATHFFNVAEGGDPMLWQHMFWFFGHPEVYIIFLPANGFVSTIVATFSRRPIFGYPAVVVSMIATAFIGFGVWVHHMFATGLPQMGTSFFTAASIMIVIPTGTQIFCWIATLWSGRPVFKTPLLYVIAFFAVFIIGGLSGVMLASIPIDLQVHDTYFVVAHLHYVLIGGALFPLFGALHFWYPKMTGRMLSESLGRVECALLFIGFNLTFFPMHRLGLMGMPRRIYTYLPETGWATGNLVATCGAAVIATSILLFVFNAVTSRRFGALAGNDPWAADGLEWETSSPPPPYNFLYLPTVRGRYARWTAAPDQAVVVGMRTDCREILVTRALDAEPHHRDILPNDSWGPFLGGVAVAITFIGIIFTPWAFVFGGSLIAIAMILWFWPRRHDKHPRHHEQPRAKDLPRDRVHEDTLHPEVV